MGQGGRVTHELSVPSITKHAEITSSFHMKGKTMFMTDETMQEHADNLELLEFEAQAGIMESERYVSESDYDSADRNGDIECLLGLHSTRYVIAYGRLTLICEDGCTNG
jgi:hypothetical protein